LLFFQNYGIIIVEKKWGEIYMSHIVKCRWCGDFFDTDKILEDEWIMPTKGQYYHHDCWLEKQTPGVIRPTPKESNDDKEYWRQCIFDLIRRDLKGECNYSRISLQMGQYKQKYKDWTYKGMFYALKWFYDIEHNDWKKANGAIGILPYIYYRGTEYWRQRERQESGIVAQIEKQILKRIEIEQNQTEFKYVQRERKKAAAVNFEELAALEDDE